MKPGFEVMATEKEWFVNNAETLLGVIPFDRSDSDWNHYILGRDKKGAFRWIDGNSSYPTQDAARSDLVEKINALGKSGNVAYPH